MSLVTVERDEARGVAVLTVSRPEKLNALSQAVLEELAERVATVLEDDGIGAFVVRGAGERAFVAGADIGEIRSLPDRAAAEAFSRHGQAVFDRIASASKPSVAAIGGYALGGGLELALACDLRVGSTRARLGQPEINLGILPGYGGTQRLARLVGPGRALDLILTGRQVSAEEAFRIGLLDRLVEPEALDAAALDLAAELAGKSRSAVALAKAAVREGLSQPLSEGLRIEAELFARAVVSPDGREGVAAFLERRPPAWGGPASR